MTIRRVLISFAMLLLLAFTVIACSGTKSICPAYSNADTETTVNNPNS